LTCRVGAAYTTSAHHLEGNCAHEADISAESASPEEDARVPGTHEHDGRAQGAQAPAGQGAPTAGRLTGRFPRSQRLASTTEIQALFQQGKRVERPSLIVLWLEAASPCRVAFAVTRQIRGAVRRNRARRRLREAFRAVRGSAPPQAALVVIAKRGALDEPFGELAAQLASALGAISGSKRSI
jgi:ribonuclease P protein component